MGDAKKLAILVRDRKSEALRMSVGLTLADDQVSAFVMDDPLQLDEEMEMNVEALKDMGGNIYTNNPANAFDQMSTEEIAKALLDYDVIIAY